MTFRYLYLTLDDGTLVDVEGNDTTGSVVVRAGLSLVPSERPVLFTLNGHDARELGLYLLTRTPIGSFPPCGVGDDDELLDAMSVDLTAREGPITLVLRPVVLLQLAVLVQVALGCPGMTDDEARSGRMFIEHARAFFSDSAAILEVLRRSDPPDGSTR